MILVVGSDGMVGAALMRCWASAGRPVLGTTRRQAADGDGRVKLDLAAGVDQWRCPASVKVAVVCAGVTTLAECKRDPIRTAMINVEGVARLVEKLVLQGVFVVYLSTGQVFDGSIPACPPDNPVAPCTEYGRQKAEAEREVKRWGDAVAVVRFSKILGPGPSLLATWKEALKRGETIQPFSDVVMAPVPLSCALSILELVASRRRPGIWQVSGVSDVTYAEAAYLGARALGIEPTRVRPRPASDSGVELEFVATHATLDITRVRSELGMEPPDVHWTVVTAFRAPSLLAGVCQSTLADRSSEGPPSALSR